MTQKELAEKSGVHIMQISKFERKETHIEKGQFDNVMHIADTLEVDPHVFLKNGYSENG